MSPENSGSAHPTRLLEGGVRGPSVPHVAPPSFSGIPYSLRGIKRAELYYTLSAPVDKLCDF